uniref:Nucleoprotein n=1 Tax=Miglotas virus TaxID=2800927 RepID=A0A894KPI5_9VIRU|nr:MAG: nucleoprotein [Miglotas virus]QRW41734.1 MAG: nucleoprotein [Miglotas virus]QRW41736.1 MAG: nucleoprotein [Miglotas virus]QRW41738.1 MAG: nucleoprotein [Miglotas virus]QRW41740.1 MAG: nucleoprotein [Miglotas virus]
MSKEIPFINAGSVSEARKVTLPEETRRDYETQEKTIAAVLKSALAKDYVLDLISPSELASSLGGVVLDVKAMMLQIAYVMPSVMVNAKWGDKLQTLDFMAKVLYLIGPQSRSIKKLADNDKHWNLRTHEELTDDDIDGIIDTLIAGANAEFNANWELGNLGLNSRGEVVNAYAAEIAALNTKWKSSPRNEEKYVISGCISIASYKNSPPPTTPPKADKNCIILTLKQASIAALRIMDYFTQEACAHGHYILTPLGGAIFSRDSINEMFNVDLIKATFKAKCNLVMAINASAQSGGQHDRNARADIAALCALVATGNVKERRVRESIVHKTVKQFIASKRPLDKALFKAMAPYATGGLPHDFCLEVLDTEYKEARITHMEITRAAALSRTIVDLGSSSKN